MPNRPLLLALAVTACSPRAAPTAPATTGAGEDAAKRDEPWIAELRAYRAVDPGDQGAAYLAAHLAVARGDTDEALRLLEAIVAAGFPLPIRPVDFPGLAELPRFKPLAERLKATPASGSAEPAFTVGPADLVPEGIACDEASGAAFVGSINHEKIVRVDGTTPRDLVANREDLGAVLGMTVDAPRRWLWAAHNPRGEAASAAGERSGVAAFDLETGAPKARADLDGEHLLNDVAVARGGDVFVTDSTRGQVWRLPGGGGTLAAVAPEGTFVYPNGLAWIDERATLLIADASGLHALDPATGERRRVARGPAPTLAGVDGLQRRGDALVAVQYGQRVLRWRLDAAALAVTGEEVLLAGHPSFEAPTTGCALGERYLVIANSHVDEFDEHAGAPKPAAKLRPLTVLAVPLR
ncbi:MAG: gluconolaconase [Myxococcales bacterium]|nr:gluconolaconase [Myxococcales bacterium]